MRKIAQIVPSLSQGGAEKVASNLSLALDNKKYDKYIIVFDNKAVSTYDYDSKLLSIDLKVRSSKLGKVLNLVELIYKVRKIKRSYKFDTTISHLPLLDLVNVITRQKSEKVITTIHNNIDMDYSKRMKRILNLIISKSDFIVSVSKVGEKYIKDNYANIDCKNVITINNFNDSRDIILKSKEPIEESYRDIFDSNVLISVGRLEIQKGHSHLLNAFKEVLVTNKNVNLVILGEGSLRSELIELVDELGIRENVYFMGFQSNPYKFLVKSKIFVSTSLYEGYPMTYIEAMCLGVPVVSVDCISGPREIIAPQSGLTGKMDYKIESEFGVLTPVIGEKVTGKPPRYAEKWFAKRIVELLNDEKLLNSYSNKAYERSRDFDKLNIIKKWEELIG